VGLLVCARPCSDANLESLPVRKSRLPYLEISVTGNLGEQNLSLELVNLATGEQTTVKPSRIAGSKWLSRYVKAPASEFKLWPGTRAKPLGSLSKRRVRLAASPSGPSRPSNAWKYLLFAGLGLFLFNLAVLPARRNSADV